MTTLFVTSSGTDIGKTHFCCQLIAQSGLGTRAVKPVVTGFDPARPQRSDSGRLLVALDQDVSAANLDAVSPWRFRAPVSVDVAAAREGRAVPFAELLAFSSGPSDAKLNLVEGIGGVMAPLDGEHTVLDWIAALETRVVLVVGSYLGSLSHSLTALAVLRLRARMPLAIVVSQSLQEPATTEETAAALTRHVGGIPVIIMRRSDNGSSAGNCAALVLEKLGRA